ncbi:hypothetical protein [uncultured Ruminococcus sp.]|uniref:hypothetical protein n=1 Tax=uncultured Ruminococcus sp. TaxID=165186 RepID=UPI0025D9C45C|nr:hypothetical protein [uncultured Ruminococcus sp.]
MEITSFYPTITTTDFEGTKAVFDALGFEVAHTLPNLRNEDPKFHNIVMKNAGDFRINIYSDSTIKPGQPCMSIWMNVRDFEGARTLFREHGFTEVTKVEEYSFLKCVTVMKPSGLGITIFYHIRKTNDRHSDKDPFSDSNKLLSDEKVSSAIEITSFHPIIETEQQDDIVKVFEELGFSVAHRFTHTHEGSCGGQSFNMKCENGFAVDITNVPPEELDNGRDRIVIRMNVRDFEGTCELLRAHGLTQCTPLIDQEHVTSMTMQAPSGFRIAVIYHKRKQK